GLCPSRNHETLLYALCGMCSRLKSGPSWALARRQPPAGVFSWSAPCGPLADPLPCRHARKSGSGNGRGERDRAGDRPRAGGGGRVRGGGRPPAGSRRRRRGGDKGAATVLPLEGDVSRREDARGWVEAARERFGRLDILVNNAG